MTELATERLLLRDFTWSDQEAVHAFAADPVATRFMDWGPNDVHDTRAFLTMVVGRPSQRERTEFDFATVLLAPGSPALESDLTGPAIDPVIGSASLRIINQQHQQGELGYIFNREFWSRGFATEATRALLAFGFGPLGLHRISATCHPDNLGSARVLEKAGFCLEGRLRHHRFAHGTWRDSMIYSAVAGLPVDGDRTG